MSEKELRPIDSEFWHEFPYNPLSSEAGSKQHRFLYKVIDHRLVEKFPDDKIGEMAETIQALKQETRNMITISRCDECGGVKYGFDEWKENHEI